jgi:hypothetical protein
MDSKLLLSRDRDRIDKTKTIKIEIYLIKEIKIQNKYIFRIILYFFY